MIRLLENLLYAVLVVFVLLAGGLTLIMRAILNSLDALKGLAGLG